MDLVLKMNAKAKAFDEENGLAVEIDENGDVVKTPRNKPAPVCVRLPILLRSISYCQGHTISVIRCV